MSQLVIYGIELLTSVHMKVISLLAVFLALLAINVSAQVATNTTDFIAPIATNTTDSIPGNVFYPLDPAVVKGGPCQIDKVTGKVNNNCCFKGFATINKKCQINVGNNPCVINTPKCTKDETCLGTYQPKDTPCNHKGRTQRRPKLGRHAGRRNNRLGQGAKTGKGIPRRRANEFNVNGFCYGIVVAEKAAENNPSTFAPNLVERTCKTARAIRKQLRQFTKDNKQALKNRSQFKRNKSDPRARR